MSRWTPEQAQAWYNALPPLLGCNFIPSCAVNQLEFWQADTFDEATVARELGWAASLGMDLIRVYLHDLVWEADGPVFLDRIDRFLALAHSRGLRTMLVLFDDCWNEHPQLGPQLQPRPGVHNSRWVQSPGEDIVLAGPSAWGRLERYVRAVLGRFGNDARVLLWDLYNEPGNGRLKHRSFPLLREVFRWAREVGPEQPLTAGLWYRFRPLNDFQLANSDVITFHCYEPPAGLERWIDRLSVHGRPLICTEWMARPQGSTAAACLPVFQKRGVGCVSWGLVAGKTNTVFPWPWMGGALQFRGLLGALLRWYLARPARRTTVPDVWFHDWLWPDGTPFRSDEVEQLRSFGSQAILSQ